MNNIGTRFGNAAVYLILSYQYGENEISEISWKSVVRKFLVEDCYVDKPCPKNTFLSMCSMGIIKGVPKKPYLLNESVESDYAKIAIGLLTENVCLSCYPRTLWKEVLKRGEYDLNKNYDYQMDVVCALWNAELIENNEKN